MIARRDKIGHELLTQRDVTRSGLKMELEIRQRTQTNSSRGYKDRTEKNAIKITF